jgi:hypothetical protein
MVTYELAIGMLLFLFGEFSYFIMTFEAEDWEKEKKCGE